MGHSEQPAVAPAPAPAHVARPGPAAAQEATAPPALDDGKDQRLLTLFALLGALAHAVSQLRELPRATTNEAAQRLASVAWISTLFLLQAARPALFRQHRTAVVFVLKLGYYAFPLIRQVCCLHASARSQPAAAALPPP